MYTPVSQENYLYLHAGYELCKGVIIIYRGGGGMLPELGGGAKILVLGNFNFFYQIGHVLGFVHG